MGKLTSNTRSDTPVPLLTDYLLADSPTCIVQVGSRTLALDWPASADNGPAMIMAESVEQADLALSELEGGRDAALESCVALLELEIPGDDPEPLLGQAVRLFSNRLVVYTRSTAMPDSALFAFGFRKLEVDGLSSPGDPLRWFEYRLSHYKQPPDWLNARFWANPERFDSTDEDDIYYDADDEEE